MAFCDEQPQIYGGYNFKLAAAQFLNSMISNTVGDVLGHPLDTVRVSLKLLNSMFR